MLTRQNTAQEGTFMLKEWEFGRDNRNKADCKALLKARREELAG